MAVSLSTILTRAETTVIISDELKDVLAAVVGDNPCAATALLGLEPRNINPKASINLEPEMVIGDSLLKALAEHYTLNSKLPKTDAAENGQEPSLATYKTILNEVLMEAYKLKHPPAAVNQVHAVMGGHRAAAAITPGPLEEEFDIAEALKAFNLLCHTSMGLGDIVSKKNLV